MVDPNNTTLKLEWGSDFELSQNGSLIMSTGWEQIKQRVLRRLLTNPSFKLADGSPISADYIFDQNYGQGCRRRVGEPISKDIQEKLEQAVNKAVVIDEGLAVAKPPLVEAYKIGTDQLWVQISITLKTGQSGTVVFGVA